MGDENDLHHVCVMVDYKILNLYLVCTDLKRFCEHLL